MLRTFSAQFLSAGYPRHNSQVPNRSRRWVVEGYVGCKMAGGLSLHVLVTRQGRSN